MPRREAASRRPHRSVSNAPHVAHAHLADAAAVGKRRAACGGSGKTLSLASVSVKLADPCSLLRQKKKVESKNERTRYDWDHHHDGMWHPR